jgi:serine/threonine-protein kinase
MNNPSFSAARAQSDPLIGELIDDRYRIERVLGTGGTGTVYLAEHVMMEKRVALKVLHATHAVVSSAMDRFQREAIALARIEHPNVVSASDFGKLKNGAYYLALEYVEGVSLGDVLGNEGRLDRDRAVSIAYQIGSALQAAHSQGIVHRDLKSHNVMITQSGGHEIVKVLDFGLAKLRSKLTQGSISMSLGQVFGTPHYMAPEQITGEGVDHRVDLYALGVILYEMLAGTRPFDAGDVREVLSQQATQEPAPLPDTVPSSLRTLVARLMAKDKEQRPASAEEVMTELQPLLRPSMSSLVSIPPVLRRQIQIGSWAFPLWVLALPAVAFVFLFVLGLVFTGKDDAAMATEAPASTPTRMAEPAPVEKPGATAPAPTPELLAGAEFGDENALKTLLEIPAQRRDRDLWLVLAKGEMAQERPEAAMKLLREAVSAKPELANDEELSRLVRLGANDAEGSKIALATAAEALGSRGTDILFSVWADTKRRTPITALAEHYLQQKEVVAHASPALKLALDLREDFDCDKARTLLGEVQKVGDTRALNPLAKLRKKRGCGAGKRLDCYPCLRDDDLLETAIAAAADRPGPKY